MQNNIQISDQKFVSNGNREDENNIQKYKNSEKRNCCSCLDMLAFWKKKEVPSPKVQIRVHVASDSESGETFGEDVSSEKQYNDNERNIETKGSATFNDSPRSQHNLKPEISRIRCYSNEELTIKPPKKITDSGSHSSITKKRKGSFKESVVSSLKKLHLFSIISQKCLEKISEVGDFSLHKKGDVLFKKGEKGLDFYFILNGAVDLNFGKEKRDPIHFTSYDYFGEEALFGSSENVYQSNAVVISDYCEIFVISSEFFRSNLSPKIIEKREHLKEFLSNQAWFKEIDDYSKLRVLDSSKKVTFKKNSVIHKVGQGTDYFYILKVGAVGLTKEEANNTSCEVLPEHLPMETFTSGDYFGEHFLSSRNVKGQYFFVQSEKADLLLIMPADFNKYIKPFLKSLPTGSFIN